MILKVTAYLNLITTFDGLCDPVFQ